MERLSKDELLYHRAVLAQRRAAEAVWLSWAAHLAAKYRLGPNDQIDESGVIRREKQVSDEDAARSANGD